MIKKTIVDDKKIFIVFFLYAFLFLFFGSKMSPLYPENAWSDANLYFNMGKAMFNGRTIYSEAFDHKGPFIFFIYGIGYLISNTSFLGMYIIESLCWGVMLCAAYLTAKLYVSRIYAFIVTLAYTLFAMSHTAEGGSAEEFILVAETISLYLFIKYFKDNNTTTHDPKIMLTHGVLCTIVFLIKFSLIIFWFFPLLAIFIGLIQKKEYKNLLHNTLTFIGGFVIITLPFCIYFAVNNALSEAWDIYIVLNKSYAQTGSIIEAIERYIVRFYLRVRFEPLEFFIILIGAIYFPYKYIKNRLGALSITLSFLSLYLVIFITTEYSYYYSVPYAIFGLPGLLSLCKYINIPDKKKIYIAAVAIFLFWGINYKAFFGLQINQVLKREAPISYTDTFKAIIAKEENPTLINLCYDSGNSIFTYLNIKPSVKYFLSPNLKYDIYPNMRDAQTEYIKNRKVQFILLSGSFPQSKHFLDLLMDNNDYKLACKIHNDESGQDYYLYKRND